MNARQQAKRDARAIKIADEILKGSVTYVPPQKRRQHNRKGGAEGQSGGTEVMLDSYMALLRIVLPGILAKLAAIDDQRAQNKVTHSKHTLFLYGMLMFASQKGSRREADRMMGSEQMREKLAVFFPDYETTPHSETLNRFLGAIDPEKIQGAYEDVLKEFIKSAEFRKLNPGRLLVAIDGTQKLSRKYEWDKRTLSRSVGDENKERHCVYMLDSLLMLENGMVLPLLAETLENDGGMDADRKQDCEMAAFHRLAERLLRLLGKGTVTLLLDGLYACGPVMSTCIKNGWGYMISLKQDSLKSVWEDFNGLLKIETDNTQCGIWGKRTQNYRWVNGIEYIYGNNHKKLKLNVVTCDETWLEMKPRSGGKPKEMESHYAWISSDAITGKNVFERCTKIARRRWRIENSFLVEKRQGYGFEHCFSYNWAAMKGFHYLMKIGHFLNILATNSSIIKAYVEIEGISGFIKKVWGMVPGVSSLVAAGTPHETQNTMRDGQHPKINFKKLRLEAA